MHADPFILPLAAVVIGKGTSQGQQRPLLHLWQLLEGPTRKLSVLPAPPGSIMPRRTPLECQRRSFFKVQVDCIHKDMGSGALSGADELSFTR